MNHRTGRTTRMLAEAAHLATDGRYVFVIGADQHHANLLLVLFEGQYRAQRLGDGKVGLGTGSVQFYGSSWLDWDQLRIPHAHPDCVVLVDHYAIECRFKKVLTMLRRYDPPQPPYKGYSYKPYRLPRQL